MVEVTRRGFLYGLASGIVTARFMPSLLHTSPQGAIQKVTALPKTSADIVSIRAVSVGEVRFLERGLRNLCGGSGMVPVNYSLSVETDVPNINLPYGGRIPPCLFQERASLEGDVPLDACVEDSLFEYKPCTFILPYSEDAFVMGDFIIQAVELSRGT